ncbi:hypothetical protein AB0J43_25485 [Nonomuraea fuscirosea]
MTRVMIRSRATGQDLHPTDDDDLHPANPALVLRHLREIAQ